MKYIKQKDPDYPEVLNNYDDAPAGLYVEGNLPESGKLSAAIVGARRCSPYGRNEAKRFAEVLSRAGIQIISGLASGIDSCAHTGALLGGTPTFAVMGCGADVCYPKSNRRLYADILSAGGGIISEYEPGTGPYAYHFPIRNRIISALSDVVIIIEARKRSGSLITASYALEQGKMIYALPGRTNDTLSCGCNELIYNGACPALSPEQILLDLGVTDSIKKPVFPELSSAEKLVLKCLHNNDATLETLRLASGMPVSSLAVLLTQMKLKGLIYEPGPGYYAKQT